MHVADDARAAAVGMIMANNAKETAGSPTSRNAQRAGQIARSVFVAQRGTVGIPARRAICPRWCAPRLAIVL